MSAWAGFFGAIPFGLGLWVPIALACGLLREARFLEVVAVMIPVAFSLAPFAIASTRVGRHDWPRVLAAVVPGLAVGAASIVLFFLAGLVLIPAGFLGLTFGAATIGPRWRRGDAAGRALALLGMAPALLYLLAAIAERGARGLAKGEASSVVPWLTGTEFTIVSALACLAVVSSIIDWGAAGFRPMSQGGEGHDFSMEKGTTK